MHQWLANNRAVHRPGVHKPGPFVVRLAFWSMVSMVSTLGCTDGKKDFVSQKKNSLFTTGKLTIHTNQGATIPLSLEIAASEQARTRGMMFRNHLEENAGMLFVFPSMAVRRFWMKNTYISLDMLFIDNQGRILGVVENARPGTTTTQTIRQKSKYVLEVNGGWATRHDVHPGDRVVFDASVAKVF